MKFITFDVTNTLIKVASSVGHQYNKILLKSNSNFHLETNVSNKVFGKLFKEQNIKHPGYGFKEGMSSRHWWSVITKQVILENYKNNHVQNRPSESDLEVAANLIFDEFCMKEYWLKYDNCSEFQFFKKKLNSNYLRVSISSV